MGKSVRKDANDTYQKILKKLCIGKVSNMYTFQGAKGNFIIEENSDEEPDGGIRGEIYQMVSPTHASKVGDFLINGDGELIYGPHLWREAIADNLGVVILPVDAG